MKISILLLGIVACLSLALVSVEAESNSLIGKWKLIAGGEKEPYTYLEIQDQEAVTFRDGDGSITKQGNYVVMAAETQIRFDVPKEDGLDSLYSIVFDSDLVYGLHNSGKETRLTLYFPGLNRGDYYFPPRTLEFVKVAETKK